MTTRQDAFEHCKFGSGAQPGASCKMDNGSSYSMSSDRGWVSVTFYPVGFCTDRSVKAIRNVALRDCPADGWKTYWTNEC